MNAATSKPKFDQGVALAVARELCLALKPVTERLIVAGSLRRRKARVSDVEILYLPKFETRRHPEDMFSTVQADLADEAIERLVKQGVLERRHNVHGSEIYGDKNKLLRHTASGVPVDLFKATLANWHNYLVCRTGPAELNVRICQAARALGWKWNAYGDGFSSLATGEIRVMGSERAVFEFVGLPFLEPVNR